MNNFEKEARRQVMIELRRDGKSLEAIGRQFGMTRERVRQILEGTEVDGVNAAAISRDKNLQRVKAMKGKEIERRYMSGESISEIAGASRTNRAYKLVAIVVAKKKLSAKRRDYQAGLLDRRQRIVELWSEGKTVDQIAAELNIHPPTLKMIIFRMREMGYDLPYRNKRKAKENV